jgi:hypothetical protein
MGLIPVGLLDAIQPCVVELRFWLVRSGDSQTVNSFSVSLGIAAPLGLGDRGFQGIDAQWDGTAANEKQAIESCAAWIASANQ